MMYPTANNAYTAPLSTGRVAVVLLIILAFLLSGCQTQPITRPADAVVSMESPDAATSPVVLVAGIPAEMLAKADLSLRWSSKVPMGRAQAIRRIFHHHGRLYVLNDRNQLLALDGDKGTVLWSVSLGAPYLPPSEVQFYRDSLLFVVGQTFVQIRETDGMMLKRLDLDIPVSTSAARTENHLFVGGNNKRFYALRAADGVLLWHNICPEEPTGTITVARNAVFFVTKENILYVSTLNQRRLLWQFRANGSLSGAVVDGDQCFLPSGDTALYCLRPDSGSILWKYLAGGSLRDLPTLTEKYVYQSVYQHSLLCLDRYPDTQAGSLRWELKNGARFLAENGSVSYALTLNRELALMNNLTGKPILSFFVPDMDFCAQNNEEPTIFLAAKSGAVIALRPNRIESPLTPPAPVETITEAAKPTEPDLTEPENVAPDLSEPQEQ